MSKQRPLPSIAKAAGAVAGAISPIVGGAAKSALVGAVDQRVSEIQAEHMLSGGARAGASGFSSRPAIQSPNNLDLGAGIVATQAPRAMTLGMDPYDDVNTRSTPHSPFAPK